MATHPTARTSPIPLVALVSGGLMAFYLVGRPYGDSADPSTLGAAEAFASPMWVATHLAGAVALVLFAVLVWLVTGDGGRPGLVARWSGVLGATLVLPYYGAETFALHEIGRYALDGHADAMELVGLVRDSPAALTTFGTGLVALAVAGLGAAWLWQRRAAAGLLAKTGMWPLAVLVALFLPQFFLDPGTRIAYGIAYGIAAAFLAIAARRPGRGRHTGPAYPTGGGDTLG